MTTCYRRASTDTVWSAFNDTICPNTQTAQSNSHCCVAGDTCLGSGICHFTHDTIEGGSGFYVADCSDAAYADEGCVMECIDQVYPDIVYNSTSNSWSCCGLDAAGARACPNPTVDRTFQAPPPNELLAAVGITASSGSSGPTSSSIPSSSFDLPTSPTSSAASPLESSSTRDPVASPSLSTAAQAGLGVGVAIAGLLIIIALAWGFYKMRKRRRLERKGPADEKVGVEKAELGGEGVRGEKDGGGSRQVQEVHGRDARVEIGAGEMRRIDVAELGS